MKEFIHNWWNMCVEKSDSYDYEDKSYKEYTQKLIELMNVRELLWT